MIEHTHLKSLEIPRMINGLWQVADMERNAGELDERRAINSMIKYANDGLYAFDMADHYGSAESLSGKTNKHLTKDQKFICLTKWVPKPGVTTKSQVREAVERALEKLQTQSLDLLQFHAWNYADANWLDSLFWLQELKEKGMISELGVTNFDAVHLKMAIRSGIEIVSNQISYSLLDMRAARSMEEICIDLGVGILAYGSLAGGFFSEKWVDVEEPSDKDLTTWSQMKYKRFIDSAGGWGPFQNLAKEVNKIAKSHGVSMANVAMRYILNRPGVSAVIVGMRPGVKSYFEDNVKTFDFKLSKSDTSSIEKARSVLSEVPGNCGDEYRYPPFLTASGDLSHHLERIPAPFNVVQLDEHRSAVDSGTVWEDLAGFSRAVKHGNRILVSGTTATHRDRLIGGGDAGSQAHFIIDKIQGAIESLGGRLEDVVRTRIYIQNEEDWRAVSAAHGARFAHIKPSNTLIRADLIGEGYKVEMEAEAQL